MPHSYRSLPAVPRGLSKDLEFLLNALSQNVSKLIGTARNSEKERAVLASEKKEIGTENIINQSLIQYKIENKSITNDKLGDAVITDKKIAKNAVNASHLQTGSVGSNALQGQSVTESKIASGVLDVSLEGQSMHGEVVQLPPLWENSPIIYVRGFILENMENTQGTGSVKKIEVRADNIIKNADGYVFDVFAYSQFERNSDNQTGEAIQEIVTQAGTLLWLACGKEKKS